MKKIPDYNGRYEITEDGRIWSNFSGRFLNEQINHLGYPIIRLGTAKNRNKKTFYIHRLVAEAFIPNPRENKEVNHKNGVKTDNRVENLEWTTRSENMKHAIRTGLKVLKRDTNHPHTKLTLKQIREILPRIDGKYGTLSKLAREYNVSPSLLSLIGHGYRTII